MNSVIAYDINGAKKIFDNTQEAIDFFGLTAYKLKRAIEFETIIDGIWKVDWYEVPDKAREIYDDIPVTILKKRYMITDNMIVDVLNILGYTDERKLLLRIYRNTVIREDKYQYLWTYFANTLNIKKHTDSDKYKHDINTALEKIIEEFCGFPVDIYADRSNVDTLSRFHNMSRNEITTTYIVWERKKSPYLINHKKEETWIKENDMTKSKHKRKSQKMI